MMALLATLLPALLPARSAASGDVPPGPDQEPRRAVERTAAALGGQRALALIEHAEILYRGDRVARGQSSSTPPYAHVPIHGRIVLGGPDRVLFEQELTAEGGTDRTMHRVFEGDGGWNYWVSRSQLSRMSPSDVRFLRTRPELYPPRALPHTYLRWALAEGAKLRVADGVGPAGAARLRWSFDDPAGRAITLAVDADSSLPLSVEWSVPDLLLGRTTSTVRFAGWIERDRIALPTTISFATAGEERERWELEWQTVGEELPARTFAPPAGVKPVEYEPSFQPRKIADGVWVVRLYSGPANTYNTMLVDLGDSIAVVDAPLVDLFYPAVSKIASGLAPGKPIRYVIATHHHFDHIGGVGAYFDQGIRAVATPRTAAVLERAWEARHGSSPDASGSRAPVEVFEQHTTLGSGSHRIDLYDIGPSPHADELVVVHLPKQRILFVADAFAIPDSGMVAAPTATIRHFAAALERLQLAVDTIVPAHGLVGTAEDLRRSLAPEPTPSPVPRVSTLSTDTELLSNGRLGGVSVGPKGEVYVANFSRTLWRVTPEGRVEILASELQGSSGNTVDRAGNVYQASFLDNRIVKIAPDGRISTLVDQGLDGPVGLTVDDEGVLYAANCRGNSISRIPPGGAAEIFAQSPDFDCPNGLALRPGGRLVVVSFKNGAVVEIGRDGTARTIAQVPESGNAHVAIARGSLFVTKVEANRIYRIDPDGNVEPFAGSGALGLEDGAALQATFSRPNGIAATPDGNTLWVNNLRGEWRGEEITRIILRSIELPESAIGLRSSRR
jgi:glyoxylase-like metal-dependent hydrolase (beta-lactamase superfamily II)